MMDSTTLLLSALGFALFGYCAYVLIRAFSLLHIKRFLVFGVTAAAFSIASMARLLSQLFTT